MGFCEGYPLPENCELRKDFPKGTVYVQLSGAEATEGPAHVNLYADEFEAVPRVPVLHLTLDAPSAVAAHEVERAFVEAHQDNGRCAQALGCAALRAALVVRHEDMPGVRAAEPSVVG